MCDFTIIDESAPLTDEQMEYMVRKTKICELTKLLREIRYPVLPGGPIVADLGVQFGSHVYELIAEYLLDHGVKLDATNKSMDNTPAVDPVHAAGGCYCRECTYLHRDARGLWCFRDYENDLKPDGFCSYGKRRDENG